MRHLYESFVSCGYDSPFSLSVDFPMAEATETTNLDLDSSAILTFTDLSKLFEKDGIIDVDALLNNIEGDPLTDEDLHDSFPTSSEDSDLDPTSPSPGSVATSSCPEDLTECQAKNTNKRRPSRRNRRKPLESKTLLAQCLLQWLDDPQHNPDAITWISKREGLFQITDSAMISSLWGSKKENKKEMNHEKLSRALRHYYKDGTLVKLPNKKRLCYKFSKSAMEKFNMHFTEESK